MKKIPSLLITTALIFTFIQLAGCKKKPVEKPPVEVCDITHMTYSFGLQSYDANFAYNSYGNPLSFTVSSPGTGNPNVIFFYDKYNRLTDYVGPYAKLDPANLPAQFSYEFWIRYVYTDQNPASLPVGDTTRTLGIYNNGDLSIVTSSKFIEKFTYDSKGRIIQVTASNNAPSPTFTYDANGNLILPNVTYDNKNNFRQTNKIWMLVDKNYSTNNPFVATTYNAAGLPTTFPASTYPGSNANFLHRYVNLSVIDYACMVRAAP